MSLFFTIHKYEELFRSKFFYFLFWSSRINNSDANDFPKFFWWKIVIFAMLLMYLNNSFQQDLDEQTSARFSEQNLFETVSMRSFG